MEERCGAEESHTAPLRSAASAGFKVGYENPSYFSRDDKKQFGPPPQRDIAKLRSNLEG